MKILSIQRKRTQNNATSVELLSLLQVHVRIVHRSALRPVEMMYRVALSMMAVNYNKSLIHFQKDDNCKFYTK